MTLPQLYAVFIKRNERLLLVLLLNSCSFCVPIQVRCKDSNTRRGKKCYGYDHTAFTDPDKHATFDAAVSFCDHSAPFRDSTSRNHYVSFLVYNALCDCFLSGKRCPIKPWITPDTLEIMKVKKSFHFQFKHAKHSSGPSTCCSVFCRQV